MTDDTKLAMLLKALLSRTDRWWVEPYVFDTATGPRTAWRLTVAGTIETDRYFLDAVPGFAARVSGPPPSDSE